MKAAVIGVGRMGRRHIKAAQAAGLDVVGVFDISPESLALAKEECALSEQILFLDLNRLYQITKPEIIIIATTADSHCDLTCMAAESGVKYILVEKPMAVSLAECDKMIEACKKHNTRLAVNHQMRFMDQYNIPKQIMDTEAYGGLKSMTVVAGNFGFSMVGTHFFEAFRYLTNEVPLEVSAWFSNEIVANPRGPQFQDRAGSIRAVTASGKRLYMEIGADQAHGLMVMYACRNGIITSNQLTGSLTTTVRNEESRALPTTRYSAPAINSEQKISPADIVKITADTIQALISGKNNVSGEDGRQALEVLVAAYQSAETQGRPVHLNKNLDRTRVFPWA